MYPIEFEPVYQNYVWGGSRIPSLFHRSLPPGRYAESWEVSDREEGMSVVLNGKWKGKTLHALCQELKEKLIGKGRSFERFPLLIKIIDAKENLSIQVHPSDQNALSLQGEPKTEMWVALSRSLVYSGLKEGVSEEAFRSAIDEKRAEHLLRQETLETGEALFVPGGRVHAICGGSLLLEIQQNSNTTYRLYDWGRKGRELHLEKGFASIAWNEQGGEKIIPSFSQVDGHHRLASIVSSPYFVVERLEVAHRWQLKSHMKTFQVLFCTKGEGLIENESFCCGKTYLIPAAAGPIAIEGTSEWIAIRLP